MHAWRPHVENDKARFCLGPRECQRGGPRGIAVGPTWNVTVFGRGWLPVPRRRKGCALPWSSVVSTCQTCQR
ncbi:hypothetical protein NC652_035844 [Populus alba x Populus x berolinensis]|nr:hypothetical protein NC652_035844 [Populus alba x Populus x berolinensis]